MLLSHFIVNFIVVIIIAALIAAFTIILITVICIGVGEIWNYFTLLQAYEAFQFVEWKGVKVIQSVLSRSSFKDTSVSGDASPSDFRKKRMNA